MQAPLLSDKIDVNDSIQNDTKFTRTLSDTGLEANIMDIKNQINLDEFTDEHGNLYLLQNSANEDENTTIPINQYANVATDQNSLVSAVPAAAAAAAAAAVQGACGQTVEIKPFRCQINAERLNHLRKKVEDAIRERKTFTIKGGFQYVRKALIHRGWIEKLDIKYLVKNAVPATSSPLTMDEVCSNLPQKLEWETTAAHLAKCEKMIISRLLQHHEVDFYWNLRKDGTEWQQRLNKNKIINRFARSLFTSKEGLCLLLQQMYWHTEPGVAFVRFPRCYTINFADQCTTFIDDFRMTACMGLLKWFTQKMSEESEISVCTATGKIPITVIKFAVDRCSEYVAVRKHVDLDKDFHKIWDHEWEQFLTNYQAVVHKGETFEDSGCYSLYSYLSHAKIALKNIVPFWPQFELDGYRNIWIMKPGNKCRGRDIQLIKDVNDVVRVMNHKLKYVVQKYIERPLLIYKTKFDIRQWFLVTSVQPLTVWMYRDCYCRFSTQKFSLVSLHESVHLTNHAVQHKYTNQDRDSSLPDDNMWDNHTFKAYLRQIGHADKWYKLIYPGMRESIIGAMLASQDTMDRRPNTFELYGADFMIAENFTPWLIEINSCPAMGPTTSVTARMCPQCFEDVVKVVIDRRRDPKSDTGLFELVYKQNLPQTPAYLGMTLSVRGKRIFKKKTSAKHKNEKHNSVKLEQKYMRNVTKYEKPKINFEVISEYHGPIIGNLIEELHDTLFKNTIEDMERVVPAAPQVSLINTKITELPMRSKSNGSVEHKMRPAGRQKATNRNVLSNRNTSDGIASTCRLSRCARSRSRSRPKTPTNTRTYSSRRCSNVHGEPNTQWEHHTASILNNKSEFIKKPNSTNPTNRTNHTYTNHSNSKSHKSAGNPLITSYNISSLSKILPGIDANTKKTFNFFTVGLGYNKICYEKPEIEEEVLLPSEAKKIVAKCC